MSKVIVIVSLKDGILDPQGKAILHAMKGLKFDDCESVSGGKIFELSFPRQIKAFTFPLINSSREE